MLGGRIGRPDQRDDDGADRTKRGLFGRKGKDAGIDSREQAGGNAYPGIERRFGTPASPTRRSYREPTDGGRRPYDELSMAIKVRNRDEGPTGNPMSMPVHNNGSPGSDASQRAASVNTPIVEGMPGSADTGFSRGTEDSDWRGGTWADSSYSATDEEAHRDVSYEPPNFLVQTLNVMFAQMKSFYKGKAMYVLIGIIALIPILILILPDYIDELAIAMGATVSNAYTGYLLCFLPLVMAFFTAKQCGTQIPNEFKSRTVFLSLPMPMHRLSFYFGKYLAGFLYCLALFLLAFGVAVACTSMKFDNFYNDVLLEALAGTVVAILVYSSTAFCIGCFIRRGSVLLPLVLNLVVFPFLFIYIAVGYDMSAALMMPSFLPDAVIQSLGFPISASLSGGSYAVVLMGGTGFELGSMWAMCAIGVVWSLGFLALGAFHMTRREA